MSETELSQPARKPSVKTVLVFVVMGASLALSGTALLFPRLLLWYFEPPIVNGWGSCGPSVEWALRIYQRLELGALVLGGMGGLWAFFRFRRARPDSAK